MSDLNDDYLFVGKSGFDNSASLVNGRPHGGVAILYKKSLGHFITQINIASRRSCAVMVKLRSTTCFLCNVYLPVDFQSQSVVDPSYETTLDEIEGIMSATSCDDTILCGDFNTDFDRLNAQTRLLNDFIDRNNLMVGWNCNVAKKESTYVNLALGHIIWSHVLHRSFSCKSSSV